MIFARTAGEPGDADTITCLIVRTDTPGFGSSVVAGHMPNDHVEVTPSYRHHCRDRITAGSDAIQIRRVTGIMFGRDAKRG